MCGNRRERQSVRCVKPKDAMYCMLYISNECECVDHQTWSGGIISLELNTSPWAVMVKSQNQQGTSSVCVSVHVCMCARVYVSAMNQTDSPYSNIQ